MIYCGSFWGLRARDLLSIKWAQVLDRDEFTINEMKTGKLRRITLNDKVKEALQHGKNQLETSGKFRLDDYIFQTKYGSPPSVSYVNKHLKLLFARYGIKVKRASTHIMRKTFACALFEKNGRSDLSLVMISDLLNHASTSVTRRYIGLRDSQFQDMYKSL